jgi:hypothetical protein
MQGPRCRTAITQGTANNGGIMDPNAALAELRGLYADLLDTEEDDDHVMRIAELTQALDQWLTGGGFLPNEWQKNR